MRTTMDDQITPLQELRILLCLIRHADAKGSVDFDNPDVTDTLGSLVWNWNAMEFLLYKLDEAGVIDYFRNRRGRLQTNHSVHRQR